MTVPVTGGAGFVGSRLVDVVVAHGYVVIPDDLSTWLRENSEHLSKSDGDSGREAFHENFDRIVGSPFPATFDPYEPGYGEEFLELGRRRPSAARGARELGGPARAAV